MPNANWFPSSCIGEGDAGRPNLHAGVTGDDRDLLAATDRRGSLECLVANRLAGADPATYRLPDDLAELGGATVADARDATGDDLQISR